MKRHSGFTLIEMLMVIVIIGALTGAVMLSVSSATDKANASKIVNNLRNLKAACVMYYSDNGHWPASDVAFDGTAATADGIKKDIENYLDRVPETGYKIYAPVTGKVCAVGYSNNAEMTDGVIAKLKKMATSAGLSSSAATTNSVYSGGAEVFMKVTNSVEGK